MPLTKEQSRLWQAMNIGPQWILRSSEDPLAEEEPAQAPAAAAKAAPASAAALHAQPARSAAPARAPARPAHVDASGGGFLVNEPGLRSLKPLSRTPAATQAPAAPKVIAVVDEALAAKVKTASWEEVKELIASCHACTMSKGRTQTVPSDGAPGCPLVFVGEAPGRDEDLEGVPFVGKSGQLLTNILKAVAIERGRDAAIINVLKCRPPNNRDPMPEEAAACRPFLLRQLELLAPKVLMLLGRTAVTALLPDVADQSMTKLRGRVFEVTIAGRPVKTMVSYHPSYLLRNPVGKEASWHDLLAVKKLVADVLAASS